MQCKVIRYISISLSLIFFCFTFLKLDLILTLALEFQNTYAFHETHCLFLELIHNIEQKQSAIRDVFTNSNFLNCRRKKEMQSGKKITLSWKPYYGELGTIDNHLPFFTIAPSRLPYRNPKVIEILKLLAGKFGTGTAIGSNVLLL